MELAQLLLVAVVSILTLLLVVVGIQALFILHDFRKSIKKFNNILEDAQSVSSSIAKPLSGSTNIFESFRQVKEMVNYVSTRPQSIQKKKEKKDEEIVQRIIQVTKEETPIVQHQHLSAPKITPTRVFKRNGRPLTS